MPYLTSSSQCRHPFGSPSPHPPAAVELEILHRFASTPDFNSLAFVTPTMEAWSLVERETVIGLYEKFFFQSDVGGYPMFHMPSLIDMPGFLSMRARGKQPMREVHLARDEPVPHEKFCVLRNQKLRRQKRSWSQLRRLRRQKRL